MDGVGTLEGWIVSLFKLRNNTVSNVLVFGQSNFNKPYIRHAIHKFAEYLCYKKHYCEKSSMFTYESRYVPISRILLIHLTVYIVIA